MFTPSIIVSTHLTERLATTPDIDHEVDECNQIDYEYDHVNFHMPRWTAEELSESHLVGSANDHYPGRGHMVRYPEVPEVCEMDFDPYTMERNLGYFDDYLEPTPPAPTSKPITVPANEQLPTMIRMREFDSDQDTRVRRGRHEGKHQIRLTAAIRKLRRTQRVVHVERVSA